MCWLVLELSVRKALDLSPLRVENLGGHTRHIGLEGVSHSERLHFSEVHGLSVLVELVVVLVLELQTGLLIGVALEAERLGVL